MVHITPFLFSSTLIIESLEKKRIFKASFHPLFIVLLVAEFVVSALSVNKWLSSWNKVPCWLLQSAHPQEYIDNTPTSLFRRKNYERNTALQILFCLKWWGREIDEGSPANFLAFLSREACMWSGIARNMISTGPQAAAKIHSRGWIYGHFWGYRTARNTGLSL